MELPQTKFQIGDELYIVEGTQCSCYKVTAINYIQINEDTINYQYLSEDAKTKKVIRALEPQLFKTWEEAKQKMSETLETLVSNTRKALDEAKDPYTLDDNA